MVNPHPDPEADRFLESRVREREREERETQEALDKRGAAGFQEGLRSAAELIHREARWQTELGMMGDPHARFTQERLSMLETIIRERIERESKGE